MNNNIFRSLVKNNGIITKVNQKNEKLETKEQFINDLLTRECVSNIEDCLQPLSKTPAEYNTDWSIIRFYTSAIKGLDNAIFLEMTAHTLTGTRETNNDTLEQLKQQKIRYISDFANYLYK